ncbi:MAG: hypothetical protein M1538_00540 [Candidatus Marsarchaeota archaeon]|jgi:hypothetical protein|nr:hypothetical protein [Candidatus Marsarchaeota archaeon]
MSILSDKLIDSFISKYNLPIWIKPYVKEYLKKKKNIRYILTFVKYGKKKGNIKTDSITLPNGVIFKKKHMVHLLNLFYYGTYSIKSVSDYWIQNSLGNLKLKHRFIPIAEIEEKRSLVIKNLISGLNYNIYKKAPSKELNDIFDYLKKLNDWNERLVAKEIILNYSYVIPFGNVFYTIFYPIAPKYMKSFKKFIGHLEYEINNKRDAENIITQKLIKEERLKQLVKDLIIKVIKSINAEIKNTKEVNIYDEIILLRDIAAVYPIYKINELDKEFEVDELFNDIDIKKLLK